jgi:hypothetical protein
VVSPAGLPRLLSVAFAGFVVFPLVWVSPPAPGPAADEACPDTCGPEGTEDPLVGSSCATVDFCPVSLGSVVGTATESCAATCRVCTLRVELEWNCSGCPNGCTYLWENRSHDRQGAALPIESGTGIAKGIGKVTQSLTTSCNGPETQFGISIEGTLGIYTLECPCD